MAHSRRWEACMRPDPDPSEPVVTRRGLLLGGFMGEATFEGALGESLPALRLGELVHVGEGTTFGLGRCTLSDSEG